jgi:filamentous hemagglutinin family protein
LGICFTLAASLTAGAGDILRGGAAGGSRASGGSGRTSGAGTEGLRQNAKDTLARTSQALQSVKAMQAAAREAAKKGPNNLGLNPNSPGNRLPNVPNGLGVGGLQVAAGVPVDLANPQVGENPALWQGAKLPVQSVSGGKTKVVIEQMKQQALLTWQTFNIGKETTLKFDQSRGGKDVGKWIAVNEVLDPTVAPSQILGSIEAKGQVYVINPNGIIFGGSSQVNVHGLIASTLPINDNLLQRGVLNNPDKQFLFSSLPIPALGSNATMPAFNPPAAPATPDGLPGDVVVQKGARLNAPTTPDHVGGRIALVGANVKNEGTISTPDGQTILAAGQQVALFAHASSDPTLRGLDVLVGAAAAGTGTATNAGLIDAPRASTTIVGKEVNQLGVINSSTSVSLNGRVDLLASYNATVTSNTSTVFINPAATGKLTIGAGSVTRIVPEYFSEDTVVGTQLALDSKINAIGRTIHLESNAQVFSPSGDVTLSAGNWKPANGTFALTYDSGQIYLDAGASINVAGSIDIPASITQNILALQLLGSELADSPTQRNGVLRAVQLYLDMRKSGTFNGLSWIGTPLGNAGGFLGLIQRTVGQLTTAGGTVNLTAGTSVVMQPGSVVDVSGGWVNFDSGMIHTTRVLSNGQLLDISQATPDRIYDGLYTGQFTHVSEAWDVTRTYNHPLALLGDHYETGYTQGADGGSISITAPSAALDGSLRGKTVNGPLQRGTIPASSALSLIFQSQDPSNPVFPAYSPTPPSIVFQPTSNLLPAAAFSVDATGAPAPLREDRLKSVVLSPDLVNSDGFGRLMVQNVEGDITVPAGITLLAGPKGSITLAGANVTIAGSLIAPGGTLSLTAFNISPFVAAGLAGSPDAVTPPPNPGRGIFTLADTGFLNTAGLIVDDRPGAEGQATRPLVLDGGTISIASYDTWLAEGASIDASGGVLASPAGKITYGSGGSISIKGGVDPNPGTVSVLGGTVHLGSALSAYSGSKPGTLSLQAQLIQIGGTTSNPNTLLLQPGFFSQGGFASFNLAGFGAKQQDGYLPGIAIAPGTIIAPEIKNYLAIPHLPGVGSLELVPFLRPPAGRTSAAFSFTSSKVTNINGLLEVRGDFILGAGAQIVTGPRGSVAISGGTSAIFGSIFAPGGTISIAGASTIPSNDPVINPITTVYIGPQSVLSTAGTVVLTPDARGVRTGSVLPGGSITVSGQIVAAEGAVLDVSGASGLLDIHPAFLGLNANLAPQVIGAPLIPTTSGLTSPLYNFGLFVPTRVDSDGGSITLAGATQLFTDATLLGAAGGPTALGGKLSISSGRFFLPGHVFSPLDATLAVQQSGNTIPVPFQGSAIGKSVLDKNGAVVTGMGYFAADRFAAGGFDALTLRGTVRFDGPVTINAARSLSIADGGVIYADSKVKLSAPYVALGTAFAPPVLPENRQDFPYDITVVPFSPTFGPGKLIVRANLIDIGNLSLQNIGRANFIADGGDIRGDGSLDVAGAIYMRAGQIYPPTGVSFTISASDYMLNGAPQSGSVTFDRSGTRLLPLSAGGTLNVYASVIDQGGVLRAPLGAINIGWDGTGTAPKGLVTGQAVASTEQLTIGRGSVTSVSAIDPLNGAELNVPYGIDVNGISWIDPSGFDISAGGVPGKKVNLAAVSITNQPGSVIDMRGGGDLYSYRWVKGLLGTRDILASTGSFAIIPDYLANYMPYAAFNPKGTKLGGDPGYVNSSLSIGDQIYLSGNSTLQPGVYTLLPARYALLPGAYLITPKAGVPIGSVKMLDDSWLMSGYRYNSLNSGRDLSATNYSRFEIVSSSGVRDRAQYDDFLANATLSASAIALGQPPPRLPGDAGQLVLQATTALTLQGAVKAGASRGFRGGLVDISSPVDILIAGPGANAAPGQLVLNSADLSRFGAESLLIGGIRQTGASGTVVTVKTSNITVDNAGAPLRAPDIILVATKTLTLEAGAVVEQGGSLAGRADTLLLGNANTAGSGNGVLLRVSADPLAQISRAGVDTAALPAPSMVIGANARIEGTSAILDSTSATSLDPTVTLKASYLSLNSGQISIQLDNPGALQPTTGLVLTGTPLENLQSAKSLSLLSYSSIDIYGNGSFGAKGNLALRAGELRGFNNLGSTVDISASNILLENTANATGPASAPGTGGTLNLTADTVTIGSNLLRINQFTQVGITASGGIIGRGTGGLNVEGALTATTPLITAAAKASQSIVAGGALNVVAPSGTTKATVVGGLGASLTLQGSSASIGSDVFLPSGLLTVKSTAGDVTIGGNLDAGGTARTFFDVTKFTDAGRIDLIATGGDVTLATGSTVNVAAASAGGDAGVLNISAANGAFTINGTLLGQAGQGGLAGSFSLDTGSLPSFTGLGAALTTGGFFQDQAIRVRTGNVTIADTVTVRTQNFNLSADQGTITVNGKIDASGARGGTISLAAGGSVVLAAGSKLTVAAQNYDAAGKGGEVNLETRGNGGATVDIQTGSTIDLSVAATAKLGQFSGTLHLRAPQINGNTDLGVSAINGTILGASKIVAEGYQIFDLSGVGGQISTTTMADVRANGAAFLGLSGTTTAGYTAMMDRLLLHNAGLTSQLVLTPGAELINGSGNLQLGLDDPSLSSDWNLATFRFGPRGAAGVLTLRAAGDIVLLNTISDGFVSTAYDSLLLAQNTALSANAQSWSYRFTAGADLTAVDYHRVSASGSVGSLKLGRNAGNAVAVPQGSTAQTSQVVAGRYQVIRTGTGDIDISVGNDLLLLNQFATIYTAGTPVLDPTMGGTFDLPRLDFSAGGPLGNGILGSAQQATPYLPQYTLAGGNLSIVAGNDIKHQTLSGSTLVADSERELPINWLYRRGFVDPVTGQFGVAHLGDIASTTWWVDFSNYFEGVATLGGGNLTMKAGRDVANVDASVATNARMAKGAPDASTLVELGGGDLTVQAGRDIDAGVYYVERGQGRLSAGGSIKTNSTRSPSRTNLVNEAPLTSETWLPTTLFLGKGSFDVSARGDVLLGPTANPFLLPGGYNNSYWYKSIFSTYAPTDSVSVSSLGGTITLRQSAKASTSATGADTPMLFNWLQNQLVFANNSGKSSYYQPWLRLNETDVSPFDTVVSLLPATLKVTAFSGDVNIVGDLTLSPSPTGTLDILSAGAINGLQINGINIVNNVRLNAWGTSTINLSDTSPDFIPGVASPLAAQKSTGLDQNKSRVTTKDFLLQVDAFFNETGATDLALQQKQALHAPGVLHTGDPNPVHIYAETGSIADLTLFSGKAAQIFSGRDITDIAFYVQNVSDNDITMVVAGRDVIAFNDNSPLRVASRSAGNLLNLGEVTLAGDIQIGGPGTLEVLAGRNLDLGIGPTASNGTALGIVSIGNARNPSLKFDGATIIAGAGIGGSAGLSASQLDVDTFVKQYLTPGSADSNYLSELGDLMGVGGSDESVLAKFQLLSKERQATLALQIFYLVLRDSGRDGSGATGDNSDTASADGSGTSPDPSGSTGGSNLSGLDKGFAAIDALFPGVYAGDISLTAREIKTKNGGDIALFAPGGKLTVGFDVSGTQALDQGILTESGGNISIFMRDDVVVGTSRIFTLRGGNEIIWSSEGDIAAGSSAKTVQSAPPTRVLIDPQSGDVQTDLAGLATGGGIGVLATVVGVPAGDVDLIAPNGVVDAGDAGIRSSGNISIAATAVLNAGQIAAGGSTTGAPSAPPPAPSLAGLASAASSTAGAANSAANGQTAAQQQKQQQAATTEEQPSIITVEVVGYGGGDPDDEERRKRQQQGN